MFKKSELITVILFCFIIASLAIAFVVLPDREFSDQENRNLEQAPELNGENFFSGKFATQTNVYFSDQFPLRDIFVKIKSGVELAFQKGENNGVLYSKDQLAVKDFNAYRSRIHITEDTDRIYLDSVSAQLDSVNKLADNLTVPLVTVIPPRTVDIADSSFAYDRPDGDKVFDIMAETLSEKTGYLPTLQLLRPIYENGDYVYYRTDHHWTTEGAYIMYQEIMKQLGKGDKIIDRNEFEIEYIENFSGTTAARANFPFYKKDTIEIWHLPDDDEYEITADGESLDGFYNRDFIEKSDKYSLFLDGTHDTTVIKKKGETDRKTLLIAKDSFANCLIPFLAREYDIVALNLATNTFVSAFANTYEADAVLIVFNTENVITTGHLGNLR
ncbi:MAG: hypothetical protein J6Q89_03300 [Clostridia bacterium]|nr:hypothetical protein [Clostridia bacterium]